MLRGHVGFRSLAPPKKTDVDDQETYRVGTNASAETHENFTVFYGALLLLLVLTFCIYALIFICNTGL